MELGCPLAIRWHGKCPCVERPGAHEVLGHKDSVRFLDFFERLQDRHSTVARIPVAQHATVLPNRYVTSMSILKQSFYRVPIIGKNNTVLWKVGVDTFHNTSCLLWTLPPSVLLFLVSKTPPMPIQGVQTETYVSLVKPGCSCVSFCCTYNKIGTIQRRLAWPLRKDDTQIREAFLILNSSGQNLEKKLHISIFKTLFLYFLCFKVIENNRSQ